MIRKIGINFNCYGGGLSVDEQVALMKKNGFEAAFCGAENPDADEKVAKAGEAGITMDNFHAPFNKINDIWIPGEAGDDMMNRLIASVEKCARLGVPALVVHLSSGVNPPRIDDIGYERFLKVMETARRDGIKICYENQRMLANLAWAFEIFGDAAFCWDTGHEACFTLGRRYMPLFGKKLGALHIHDNHGEFNKDEHLIPGDGTIDFMRVARSISESGYTGTLMLEVIRKNSDRYPEISAEEYYAKAGEAVKKLAAGCNTLDRFV